MLRGNNPRDRLYTYLWLLLNKTMMIFPVDTSSLALYAAYESGSVTRMTFLPRVLGVGDIWNCVWLQLTSCVQYQSSCRGNLQCISAVQYGPDSSRTHFEKCQQSLSVSRRPKLQHIPMTLPNILQQADRLLVSDIHVARLPSSAMELVATAYHQGIIRVQTLAPLPIPWSVTTTSARSEATVVATIGTYRSSVAIEGTNGMIIALLNYWC